MRSDFAVLILSHGRPTSVNTLSALYSAGYTGKTYIVVDDEDPTLPDYLALYGNRVVVFSKTAMASFDVGDNFPTRAGVIYARNASFQIARDLGLQWFLCLDDDYRQFAYRINEDLEYESHFVRSLDLCLDALIAFMAATPFASVAMMQNGDFFGGKEARCVVKGILGRGRARKAMNTFLCNVDRPFQFAGRINEDVNTYTCSQRSGAALFMSHASLSVAQKTTQSSSGGMTDLYLASGTYVKSFYSVMYAPSCVSVSAIGRNHFRVHHRVKWSAVAPCFVPTTCRRRGNERVPR